MLRLATEVAIADLGLSVRSYNCLTAASVETLNQLLYWTPAQLMDLPNLGRKCLNEITDIVRELGYEFLGVTKGTQPSLPLPEGSAPLACLLQTPELVPSGVLPDLFSARGWRNLSDLAVHSTESLGELAGLSSEEKAEFEEALNTLSLQLPLELPAWFLQNEAALRSAFRTELDQLKSALSEGKRIAISWAEPVVTQSLNDELSRLIPASYKDKNRRIILDLLGLGGKDPLTLDEVARVQLPPLTRERVRQIARPLTDALSTRGRELPWLLKAVAKLKSIAPCDVKQAEHVLLDEKILDSPITVEAILRLARRSHIDHGLLWQTGRLFSPDTARLVDEVMAAAGKLSSRWGVADWRDLEPLVPEMMISAVKEQLCDVLWLDAEQRYLVVPERENSLANRLARILTVMPRLRLVWAYQGVFRDARMDKERLAEDLFAAFCGVWPWCTVEGDEVVAKSGLPPSEASGDDLIVLLLTEIGRPVRRRELTERALEQGIGQVTISQALSYSNVIAAANGYFAVIGDLKLEAIANGASVTAEIGAANVPVERLESAGVREDGDVVPDFNEDSFAGQLMLAVQERAAALELTAPWSVSELRLSKRDRDRLFAWGGSVKWEFRADFKNYLTKSGEKVRKRTAFGLAFLLFASEAVRRFGDSGSVWPAIEGALGEPQRNLVMFRTGVPKPALREVVEAACRTFGFRHGFEDVGQQVWVRTFGLQSGLHCSQLPGLGGMLANPWHLPLAIQLLLDREGPNTSMSFQASWKLLQDTRHGVISEKITLERFAEDSWLSPFPADELLAECLRAPQTYVIGAAKTEATRVEPYGYFGTPVLCWRSDEAYLEYGLNQLAPPWRESDTLVYLCEDPFRRERVPIKDNCWQLPGGPVRVSLTQRAEAGFRFQLMQGKEAVFADWMSAGLPNEIQFVFFRASGVMIGATDDLPMHEDLVLLHKANVRLEELDAPLVYRVVLRGASRLTRLPAGVVSRIRLVSSDGITLWSLPGEKGPTTDETYPLLRMRGGKWGTSVDITLPDFPFKAEQLRLNSGEALPIVDSDGRSVVKISPDLGRAQVAVVQGSAGAFRRSARVKLYHLSPDFGAAVEADGRWQPLDGSGTLDATTLRTQRLLAKVKNPLNTHEDVCWMEGSRTVAGLRNLGMSIVGVYGLGEGLNVVRGIFNRSEIEVRAARAITDGGFWSFVKLETDGRYSGPLPFEGPLEGEHALWEWSRDSGLPRELPREQMEKRDFILRWAKITDSSAFGWAFSFRGARVASVVQPERLREFICHLDRVPWVEAAMWIRWWHVPVLHAEVFKSVSDRVRKHPVETLKAWLLPACQGSRLIFDELHEEAWATATRECLWSWRPGPMQAVELVKAMGIWTGDIEHDSQQTPSIESVGLLARMNPILLADAITQALPALYPYPKSQLAALLGMALETINPNATASTFRLDDLCERYAKGESRLDGRFIMTRLVNTARALLRGGSQDSHNLRVAFHQPGLRQLISTALLRDAFERWRSGTED
jgi:hypothetical protein